MSDRTFLEVVSEIAAAANKEPAHERIGYLKGAIAQSRELNEADRQAAFVLLGCAGGAVQPTQPGQSFTFAPVIAPSQTQVASPNISQSANPTNSATSNPQVTVAGTGTSRDLPGKSADHARLVATISALALVLAALITARCTRSGGDAATPRLNDPVAPTTTAAPTASPAPSATSSAAPPSQGDSLGKKGPSTRPWSRSADIYHCLLTV